MSFKNIYQGKKVLITGHTGFKGSWLSRWLIHLNADIVGISLALPSTPNNFSICNISNEIKDIRLDIREKEALCKVIIDEKPDFIFHLAAQAIVRKSYIEPHDTWSTNLIGTINLLEAVRALDVMCSVVLVTSDKCYRNAEWLWGYRENDMLGGVDPYSASKAAAELAFSSYAKSYFGNNNQNIRIATARAGNVIGGGDWAEDRLVPDCARAWSNNLLPAIRNPHATRPWQHVLEPLSGYLCLGQKLSENISQHGESFNFGPTVNNNHAVVDLVKEMSKHWKLVRWNEVSTKSENDLYEAGLLRLNCDKALSRLSWSPTLEFEETVKMTSEWYRNYYQGDTDMSVETLDQILEYEHKARRLGINWAH